MPKRSSKKSLVVVSPEMYFWVNHGPVLKDLKELCNALKTMSKVTFEHHTNKEKNDFAKWVEEALGDAQLARKLARCKSPASMSKAVDACLKAD